MAEFAVKFLIPYDVLALNGIDVRAQHYFHSFSMLNCVFVLYENNNAFNSDSVLYSFIKTGFMRFSFSFSFMHTVRGFYFNNFNKSF